MRQSAFAGNLAFLVVMLACSASVALAQSQSGVNSQTQSQAPPQPAAKSTPQPPSQSTTQSQDAVQPQEDSLAEAARKARAKKAKTEPAKVYSDENISGLKGGVSVVGDGNSSGGSSAEYGNSSAEPRGNDGAKSGGSEEDRWRGKARRLLDQIAATDSEIKKVREEIEKYGNVGFDPSTGLRQNVIYVEDRNANLQKLESRKAELEKQMDALQEEGRKAGAEPSWFR